MTINNKKLYIFYVLFIFLFMLIFFVEIHPLYIFDSDDWLYVSYSRKAVPVFGDWNPIKVLPETFMSFCAWIAVCVLMPFTNDYILSMAIIFGIIVAAFITCYIASFTYYLWKKTNLELKKTLFISFIFLLFHFLVFKSENINNKHMFYCPDVTCYFNYLIPTLLNIMMVIFLECISKEWKDKHFIAWQGIILGIYLSVFSNLFSSYLLAVYAGIKVLKDFCGAIKEKKWIKRRIADNKIYFMILILWFISLGFELSGGRADSFQNISFMQSLKDTVHLFISMGGNLNHFWIILNLLLFLCFLVIAIKEHKMVFGEIMLNMGLTFLYLILLSAKVSSGYIVRTDVLLGLFFWWNMLAFRSLAYAIKSNSIILFLLPLLSYIVFFEIPLSYKTFREPNPCGLDSGIVKKIDDSIIAQIKTAKFDENVPLQLLLPDLGNGNEWIFDGVYSRYGESLYRHGLIQYPVKTTVLTDVQYNELYDMQ